MMLSNKIESLSAVSLCLSTFTEALQYEPHPLNLWPMLCETTLSSPVQWAAFLAYLLNRGISTQAMIDSGLLYHFIQLDRREGTDDPIEQTYTLLHQVMARSTASDFVSEIEARREEITDSDKTTDVIMKITPNLQNLVTLAAAPIGGILVWAEVLGEMYEAPNATERNMMRVFCVQDIPMTVEMTIEDITRMSRFLEERDSHDTIYGINQQLWKRHLLMAYASQRTNAPLAPLLLQMKADNNSFWNRTERQGEDRVVHAVFESMLNRLTDIVEESHTNDEEKRQSMTKVLHDQWHGFNVSRTPLMYTAIPHSPLSVLCCITATWISENSPINNEEKPNPLKLLMPGIQTESIVDDYPDLEPPQDVNPVEWLLSIIATHVLSESAQSLFPVKLLTSISDTPGERIQLPNPYSRDDGVHDDYFVSVTAFDRLASHSALTRAIVDARKALDTISAQDNSLLARLYQLAASLRLNSTQGEGSEHDAAGGAYPAIISFNRYYETLLPDLKARIPNDLKEEIQRLQNFGSPSENKENNIQRRHVDIIQTCISLRRDALYELIVRHQQALSRIKLTNGQGEGLIIDEQKVLEQARITLTTALEQKHYPTQSADRGEISQDLMGYLNCSSDQITQFMQSIEMQRIVIGYLTANLENSTKKLSALFCQMTPEQITAFLTPIIQRLMQHGILRDLVELTMLIVELPSPQQVDSIFLALKAHLPLILKNSHGLNFIFNQLSLEACSVLLYRLDSALVRVIESRDCLKSVFIGLTQDKIDALLNYFPPILYTNPNNLNRLLRDLAPNTCPTLLNRLGSQQPEIIKTPSDLKTVLVGLTKDQSDTLLKAFNLSTIIQDPDCLLQVLDQSDRSQRISSQQCTLLLETVQSQQPEILVCFGIIDIDQGFMRLANCSSDQITQSMQPKLMQSILIQYLKAEDEDREVPNHMEKLAVFFVDRTAEQITAFLTPMVPRLFKNPMHRMLSYTLLESLINAAQSAEQVHSIFPVFQAHLPLIFKDPDDLNFVLQKLSLDGCSALLNSLKDQLPQLVQTPASLTTALLNLPKDKTILLLSALDLSIIITNGHCLSDVLCERRLINSGQRTFIIDQITQSMQSQLMQSIVIQYLKAYDCHFPNHMEKLAGLFVDRTAEQITAFLTPMVPRLFENRMLSYTLLKSLINAAQSAEQVDSIFLVFQAHLPLILKNPYDLNFVLQQLSFDGCSALLNSLKDQLPQLVQTPDSLTTALLNLPKDKTILLLSALDLSIIITNGHCLSDVLCERRRIDSQLRTLIIEQIRDRFSDEQTYKILNELPRLPSNLSHDLGILSPRLPVLIQSCSTLKDVSKFVNIFNQVLSPWEHSLTCERLKAWMLHFVDGIPAAEIDSSGIERELGEEAYTMLMLTDFFNELLRRRRPDLPEEQLALFGDANAELINGSRFPHALLCISFLPTSGEETQTIAQKLLTRPKEFTPEEMNHLTGSSGKWIESQIFIDSQTQDSLWVKQPEAFRSGEREAFKYALAEFESEYQKQTEPSVRADALVVLNALKQALFNYEYTGDKNAFKAVASTAIGSEEANRLYIHHGGVFKDLLNRVRSLLNALGLTSAARFFQPRLATRLEEVDKTLSNMTP